MKDIFKEYLEDAPKDPMIRRALTDRSCRRIRTDLGENDVNTELATYGDAVLKLALCEILMGHPGNLSKEKQLYESDRALLHVAKHYDLLSVLDFDRKDPLRPQSYEPKGKVEQHKYLATAVEALLGAIYFNHHDMKEIRAIVENWMMIIDRAARSE